MFIPGQGLNLKLHPYFEHSSIKFLNIIRPGTRFHKLDFKKANDATKPGYPLCLDHCLRSSAQAQTILFPFWCLR